MTAVPRAGARIAARVRAAARIVVLAAFALALASLPFLHSRHGETHTHDPDARLAGDTAPPHAH